MGDIKEDGVKVEVTFVPEDPSDPSTVSVSGLAVEACQEGMCVICLLLYNFYKSHFISIQNRLP